MTTEKMPDVINITVSKNAVGVKDYQVSKLKPNTRYLRAEPVEALLKSARDVLNSANNTYLGSEYIYTLKPDDVENTINAIDKFLGEK